MRREGKLLKKPTNIIDQEKSILWNSCDHSADTLVLARNFSISIFRLGNLSLEVHQIVSWKFKFNIEKLTFK